ncbi:hypothetical protein A35E_00244 [secondary endosymbiont of Heteropsylla cubana]|uniref:DNA recombination protein RmuC n=1 Tax=secondary endosymbiont of Heteropsylla cubana TaxID=134287 RepID=J3YT27_9ENTR|nr:DNA recombination protein RmuC [secondary endosymbiont of Heteropsylla cubana]AFP85553.1 hypothetical protein A35E_00244 [secondary endosymbiont of Heteropsylla cubana]
MSYSVFFYIIGPIIGISFGWCISKVFLHKRNMVNTVTRISLEKRLQETNEALIEEKNIRKQTEIMLRDSECEQHRLFGKLASAEEQLTSISCLQEKCKTLNQALLEQKKINDIRTIELCKLSIRLEENKKSSEEKQRLLTNNEQRLSVQFENLSNRIFSDAGRKIDEQNRQSLNCLLIPLREKLEGFYRQVEDNFGKESHERHILTQEIRNLQQLNSQIAQEAINLSRALKGNNKIQGNWGEVVLQRVLETSGLRENHEFETQISIQQNDGRRLQPDVIVRLPQEKDVIIDAKVSLVAYERYFNSENDHERQLALNEHINSIRTHIKFLGNKNYQNLPGLRLLDYILLFIPIEPAFILAISQQPDLISEALLHNIILVSPTTLLVALRTINNLWRYEYQSKNAQHIADRATRLYDKLRLFIDDIHAIGQSLDKAKNSYQLAKNKLYEGRGNIISQAERFRALGIKVKRPIITPQSDIPHSFAENVDVTLQAE